MADLKITQLTELTSPAVADMLAVASDPAGTPVTKKISITNIMGLVAEPATDDTYVGPSIRGLNAGATIAQWELVILNSSGVWVLTDANTSSIYAGMLGLATTSGTNTNPLTVAVSGSVIRNDGWTWTAGQTLYMSETAGAITATAPTTTDAAMRVIGYALTDDCIYFAPSPDYITHA